MIDKRFTTKEEVLNQLNKLYEESEDLITKKEDAEYELLHLKEKYEELLEENERLKKELDQFYLLIGRGDWSGLADLIKGDVE